MQLVLQSMLDLIFQPLLIFILKVTLGISFLCAISLILVSGTETVNCSAKEGRFCFMLLIKNEFSPLASSLSSS